MTITTGSEPAAIGGAVPMPTANPPKVPVNPKGVAILLAHAPDKGMAQKPDTERTAHHP